MKVVTLTSLLIAVALAEEKKILETKQPEKNANDSDKKAVTDAAKEEDAEDNTPYDLSNDPQIVLCNSKTGPGCKSGSRCATALADSVKMQKIYKRIGEHC